MLTRDEVIERSLTLPSFPHFVNEIIASLDDPDASLALLSECVVRDPLITARVLSAANSAMARTRHGQDVNDVYTATSLVGMSRVRAITLISSIGAFVGGISKDGVPPSFWRHCVSVGVCSEELALYVDEPMSTDAAMIAGLLHDIGQLWFYSVNSPAYRQCLKTARREGQGIEEAERAQFGVDHSMIGAWLAEHWELPTHIIAAIAGHHVPDASLHIPLVPVVHIAEVLSHALDLAGQDDSHIGYVSAAACERLGVVWDASIRPLFGRIDARSRHANTFFAKIHRP
jgi:HD-like signal output (HDOD) protein